MDGRLDRDPPRGGDEQLIEQVFREQWARVLAHVIGLLGDFDRAEEAVQEAFALAAERWPRDGVPANPGGWLVATARNRAIDGIRRERTLSAKVPLLAAAATAGERPDPTEDDPVIVDERLELIFMCCHPALSTEAQVALTLRAVGGLRTDEIARAFLVPPETMKRRLTRAKAKIDGTAIPFALPPDHLLPDRLNAVLAVVYLIFNEGYGGRGELASEAIRLGRVLVSLMPDEPEVGGLLALMLLHDARQAARFAGSGTGEVDEELVLLEDQDRALWDHEAIAAGRALLDCAIAQRGRGPYVLQAAIASLQADTPIDWGEVQALYAQLAELTGSPVVQLNRAVALAEAGDPLAALEIVDALTPQLDGYQYLHSTRGELLSRLGRTAEARCAYERALELCRTPPERRFLQTRLSGL